MAAPPPLTLARIPPAIPLADAFGLGRSSANPRLCWAWNFPSSVGALFRLVLIIGFWIAPFLLAEAAAADTDVTLRSSGGGAVAGAVFALAAACIAIAYCNAVQLSIWPLPASKM